MDGETDINVGSALKEMGLVLFPTTAQEDLCTA
jgi:hypothetical protein